MRYPSYNPPAFDADEPPPAADGIMTPPPNYDVIIGTPSVDGLADYFMRLADYDEGRPSGGNDEDEYDEDDLPTPPGLGIVPPTPLAGESVSTPSAVSSEETPTAADDEDSEESSEDEAIDESNQRRPSRIHSGGRVHVANPLSPSIASRMRSLPSRSLDIERPQVVL
jgi:hypothetical protein